MISALVVAAGRGARLSQSSASPTSDKLFLPLADRPVLAHCLARIQQCADVHEIVVVARPEKIPDIRALAENYSITKLAQIVEGGAERQDSVWNGLQALNKDSDIVAVQDGARPFFPAALMPQLVAVARLYGSAVVCTKVTDTVKEVDAAQGQDVVSRALPPCFSVVRTVDRNKLRAVQTPQVFQVPLLKRAYARVRDKKLQVTDEAAAAELLGEKVQLVENPAPNPKITTPLDLSFAESVLKA
jgi:2-C-methyl-D-erythritol 4-phosphate cytidylyltransferase